MLEGKTREEQAAVERLEAEKRFNELFNQVKGYFTSDEAEVYKQGNRLIIRLSAMQFPVGQAVIMPSNYGLLSKVQRSIRTFGEPSLVRRLEGRLFVRFSSRRQQLRARHDAYVVVGDLLHPKRIEAEQ